MSERIAGQVVRRRRESPPPEKKSHGAQLAGVAVVLAASMILMQGILNGPNPGEPLDAAPPDMVGDWRTADPRYADRGFRLTENDIVILRGPDDPPGGGHIESIRTWKEYANDIVRVAYTTEGGEDVIDFVLHPDGTLRLRNPSDVVWSRR